MRGIGQLIGFVLFVIPSLIWNALFGSSKVEGKKGEGVMPWWTVFMLPLLVIAWPFMALYEVIRGFFRSKE